MLSEKIGMQDFAKRVLTAHIEKDRIAHSYLLTGKATSGKDELAMGFAMALNCEMGSVFKSCACNACRKIEARNHPDVRWLPQDPEARSIKIEEVREAIAAAHLKPYEGRWKVFILTGADRLTMEASNSLLKTLEEPPAHTVFILLVENRANLLETIQSRSFEVRLRPLGEVLPVTLPGGVPMPSAGVLAWEDFFDGFQKLSREDLRETLAALMLFVEEQMTGKRPGWTEAGTDYYLDLLRVIGETREAVGDNVNQKLALSRLSMQMRRIDRAARRKVMPVFGR